MNDWSRWQEVMRTRKDHPCFGCMQKIPAGSHAHNHAGTFEGDFSQAYFCDPCKAFMDANPEYFEEGIYFGDIGVSRRAQEAEEAKKRLKEKTDYELFKEWAADSENKMVLAEIERRKITIGGRKCGECGGTESWTGPITSCGCIDWND